MCRCSGRRGQPRLLRESGGGLPDGHVPRQVINGLKQRILKLEQQCKEKDGTIRWAQGLHPLPCLLPPCAARSDSSLCSSPTPVLCPYSHPKAEGKY